MKVCNPIIQVKIKECRSKKKITWHRNFKVDTWKRRDIFNYLMRNVHVTVSGKYSLGELGGMVSAKNIFYSWYSVEFGRFLVRTFSFYSLLQCFVTHNL